jgi:predicted phage gp36 major capsid-like protein
MIVQMDSDSDVPMRRPPGDAAERAERRAQALRDNLLKRKAQARGRRDEAAALAASAPPKPGSEA